jgi:adenylate kinase
MMDLCVKEELEDDEDKITLRMIRNSKLAFLGPPGSGKGTQAKLLSKEINVPHICTGDILRNEISNQTVIGKEANRFISRGLLVPDQIVVEIVTRQLDELDCTNGFILDGFPRTLVQAKALDFSNVILDFVIHFSISTSLVLTRLSGRRVCPVCNAMYHIETNPSKTLGVCDRCNSKLIQRIDDLKETIKRRIDIYNDEIEPLLSYYREHAFIKLLIINHKANGSDSPQSIFVNIKDAIGFN